MKPMGFLHTRPQARLAQICGQILLTVKVLPLLRAQECWCQPACEWQFQTGLKYKFARDPA
jgi:hypothetical protein